ncbi:MAG TPA: DUF885 domain-containing protein [Mycobacteriales bacterium]|nr:DUF885 domain-containing protein [Mycobacteriales bacterium]
MTVNDLVREYLLLGLRFDRLVDGFVDAYTGDPALRAQVGNEPAPAAADLAKRARELRAELPSSGLPDDRAAWLDGQLTGLETSGRKLAGEDVGFVDEVESYFQVRIAPGDPDEYEAAHRALDELLPGDGPLAERFVSWREREVVPPERLQAAVDAFSSDLRDRVRATYPLPEEETVEYQVVTGKPWSGFNYYLGGYRSRVAINADLPVRKSDLPKLVAHESYPGHHTEHCRKERLLVEGGARAEHTVFLVNTPECLMAEGLADLGVRVAVGPGWGAWAHDVYADLGIAFDGAVAEAVGRAAAPLNSVRQDAAIMLQDRGVPEDEAVAYLVRWGLVAEDRARKSLAFLTDPLWRAYTSTYVEGYRLLGRWLDAGDAGERFRRLLDEPLTPRAIQESLA